MHYLVLLIFKLKNTKDKWFIFQVEVFFQNKTNTKIFPCIAFAFSFSFFIYMFSCLDRFATDGPVQMHATLLMLK